MTYDDIVIGAGHNGLTAAAYLARAGRRVLVLEKLGHVGGAAVSAPVFDGIDAQLSRYAYLVSLLPRRLVDDLGLDLRLARRRYSSYTPDPKDPGWGLLVDNADETATARAFRALTLGEEEYAAWRAFHARIGRLAERDLADACSSRCAPPRDLRSLVDDEQLWAALTQVPLGSLIWEYFRDDVVRGVVATDGLIGTFASVHSEDLVQNVCFLYHVIGGGTGEWDVPVGGMGAVTAALERAAVDGGRPSCGWAARCCGRPVGRGQLARGRVACARLGRGRSWPRARRRCWTGCWTRPGRSGAGRRRGARRARS